MEIPIKKLFRIALYTSTAIGMITLIPVYIITFSIINIIAPETFDSIIQLLPVPPSLIAFFAIVFISLLIFIYWTINILLTYILSRYSIRISAKTKYIISYVLCILLFFLIHFVTERTTLAFFHQTVADKISYFGLFNAPYVYMELMHFGIVSLFAISANTVILIIQDLMLLREKKAIVESENAQLRIKNIEANYHQLQQHIHPHFLFNSLNTLKTLIKKQPENAEIYLKKLSDFLRASIMLDNENVVKLSDELKLCLDYLDIQKARFGEALQYTITIPDETKSGFVPVFSIQQLLENAIKHNVLTKESPLLIKVENVNDRIIVTNTVNVKNVAGESTGMGLSNLAERYRILSGDEIIIKADNNQFSVSLKILSHEDSNHRG